MKPRLHPFISLIAALLLVLAQQGALAHMIGHLGAGTESRASENDSGHDAALSLSHACTACVAFASLAATAPGYTPPFQIDGVAPAPTTHPVITFPGARPPAPRARAPTAFS